MHTQRPVWLAGDQDGAEIVDVGQGRSGDDLVAQRLEEAVAVVVGEARAWVEPQSRAARARVSGANDRAGVVLGAVDAVGVAGERPDARRTRSARRRAQQELDVAPAAALAAHGHRGLAAGEQHAGRRQRVAV